MRVSSPLSNLSETIRQVKQSATMYRETLLKNEAATRTVLIDPILRALGWDTANTYMVEVEKVIQQTRVDYALYDHGGTVRIVVEAKALGSNLDERSTIMSIVRYAYTYKIQDIFLTDGLVWKHTTSLQPENMDMKAINLMADSPVASASFLVQRLDAATFWPEEETIDRLAQRVEQLETIIATLQKEIADLKIGQPVVHQADSDGRPLLYQGGSANQDQGGRPLAEPAASKPIPQREVRTSGIPLHETPQDTHFVDLETITNVTGTKPALLRLPDGALVKTRTWHDVLSECAKFALRTNPQIPIPFLDRAGKRVRLIDVMQPRPGLSFVEESYNGRPVYIYVHYSAHDSVSNALHVLKTVPLAAQKIKAAVVLN